RGGDRADAGQEEGGRPGRGLRDPRRRARGPEPDPRGEAASAPLDDADRAAARDADARHGARRPAEARPDPPERDATAARADGRRRRLKASSSGTTALDHGSATIVYDPVALSQTFPTVDVGGRLSDGPAL